MIAGFLLLIFFLGACVPEREVDSLWYHLAVPLYYIQHGGAIQLVPFNMPSHYPMNLHLHYTLSLLVGNDTTAKAFITCHFFPILVLLWLAVKRTSRSEWGLFAVTLYLCCLHFRLPVMANNEQAVYFYVFLSMVLLWEALERWDRTLFILAALFCGMAMGTKFNGLLFGYMPQGMLLAGWALTRARAHGGRAIRWLLLHSLIAWSLMSPWLIKSYMYTHNPFYPLLGEIFPTDPDFIHAMHSNDHNHGLNLLKSHSAGEFFGQVWKNVEWLLYNDDLLFFLGLLATVMLVFLPASRKIYPLVTGLLAYALFPMMWGSDIARLFAVNYGVIVLLITWVIQIVGDHLKKRSADGLYWLILLSLFITFLMQRQLYLRSPNIQWFGGVYLSESAREEWLTQRHIFSRDLFDMREWLKENIPPNEDLYGYRTGYLFYLFRPYIVSGAHFGEQMDAWLETGPEYTRQRLHALGVKWLLYGAPGPGIFTPAPHPRFSEWINRYGEPVHREGNATLYRLREE